MKKQPTKQDRNIVLRERKSRFVDIFRTTPPKTVCPNFFVLAHANGCRFAPQCSYCYLKSSFRQHSEHRVFTNTGPLLRQVRAWIRRDNLESYVLNSGNLSDSLSFEETRPLMPLLVELFRTEAEARGRKHALLLVTKGGTRDCAFLRKVRPCANVIVSFSVNNQKAAEQHESGTAAVRDRLAAARALKKAGWRIRMRIDPMIAGYDYGWIVRQVKTLDPERITLGSLRAESGLEDHCRGGLFSELETPADTKGLARYPKQQRLAMYRNAISILGRKRPIGLCEETKDIWQALKLDIRGKTCNCGS